MAPDTASREALGVGRDSYAEAGSSYRYSLTQLHRELPEQEAGALGIPRRPSSLAVAVHGVVAGGYLASWSKTSDTIRWPLHAIAEAMGLDPVADSEGGALPAGNGNRGKRTRGRIRLALDELAARGSLRVTITQQRRALYARVQLPAVPESWSDPTYAAKHDGGAAAGTDGTQPVPHGVPSGCPTGYTAGTPRGTQQVPLTEKYEKQTEQTTEQHTIAGNGSPLVRPSVDDAQEQPRGGTGRIPPGPERAAGNGGNGAGVSRSEREHVAALARALPQTVTRAHPHDAQHLAALMLAHGAEQHRDTLRTLRAYLDCGAEAEVAAHLLAASARWNGEARSLAGLVLTWLRDLPATPRYRLEEYRYGFPLRDAMRACGLAGGTRSPLVHATFAMAAEAVVDAGHDPQRDRDAFAATLAATVLQLVHEDDEHTATALRGLAADAAPVPFKLPDVMPGSDADAPERGLAALHWLGLGYPDPRAAPRTSHAAGSGGVHA